MEVGFAKYQGITSIVGDIVNLRIKDMSRMSVPPRNRDLALIEQNGETFSMAQIIRLSPSFFHCQQTRLLF